MGNKYATHGALLAQRLKMKPHTHGDMQRYAISTCPHKRVKEWLKLHPEWRLDFGKSRQKLVTWRIVKAG